MLNWLKTKIKKNGFTLVEALVSMMMVSIAFLGIYSAVSKYAQQTKQIKDTYIASLLGQEGIEIVRNIRDKNWVTGAAWDAGLTSCSGCNGHSNGCQADYNDASLSAYNDTTGYLWINNDSFYDYGGTGTMTSYKRQICIDETGGKLLHLVVNIYWAGGRQTTIKEDLYNWKW